MNLYFGCATRDRQLIGPGGGKEDCLLLPLLFADVDVRYERHQGEKIYPASRGDALLLVERFPLTPTVVMWTGGGIHVYWKLRPALGASEAEPLLDRLKLTLFRLAAEHGVEVDNVFELARNGAVAGFGQQQGHPRPR